MSLKTLCWRLAIVAPFAWVWAARGDTLQVPTAEFATIQAAIDAAFPGDEVVVADGAYTGAGNKDLDFAGKAITVRSASGDPATCIIDCEGGGRGFYFHNDEMDDSVVAGFTIRNGYVSESSPGGEYGGGVYCQTSSPTLTNCIISGNAAGGSHSSGGGVYCSSSSSPTLANCTISGNTADSHGGGVSCLSSSSPVLTDCTISGNTARGTTASHGGGVYSSSSSPTLTDCTISRNTASGGASGSASGGGGYFQYPFGSGPKLTNCTITGNTARGSTNAFSRGGGIRCLSCSPTLTNCSIAGNTAGGGTYSSGGGVHCSSSSPTLTNCTISGNIASGTVSDNGGGLYCESSSSNPTLTNCILWADSPQEVYVHSGTAVVTYCDVQGGWSGTGNINKAPRFVDADGPDNDPDTWEDNDYHLQLLSPCVNRGDPNGEYAGQTDMDGEARVMGRRVDMGADELLILVLQPDKAPPPAGM